MNARPSPLAEKPDAAVEPCSRPACVVSYTGSWVAMLNPCDATECGKPGKQKRWYRCSTGTNADCDPASQSQRSAAGSPARHDDACASISPPSHTRSALKRPLKALVGSSHSAAAVAVPIVFFSSVPSSTSICGRGLHGPVQQRVHHPGRPLRRLGGQRVPKGGRHLGRAAGQGRPLHGALPPARGPAGHPRLQKRKGGRRPGVEAVRVGRILGGRLRRLQRHLRIGNRAGLIQMQHEERRGLQIDWSAQQLRMQPTTHRWVRLSWLLCSSSSMCWLVS